VGHAKVLLTLPEPDRLIAAAQRVVREGRTVRQTEQLVADLQNVATVSPEKRGDVPKAVDVHTRDLQNKLQETLKTKVQLKYNKGRGAVEIQFYSDDELSRILDLLGIRID
jgi:ParB family chromosome partitioning protein